MHDDVIKTVELIDRGATAEGDLFCPKAFPISSKKTMRPPTAPHPIRVQCSGIKSRGAVSFDSTVRQHSLKSV